ITAGDEDAAGRDCDAAADEAIRHPTAEEREEVRAAQVEAPDGAGALVAESQSAAAARRDQEEDEDRLDAVVSESLPHLREEEGCEAARMAESGGPGSRSIRGRRCDRRIRHCGRGGFGDRAHASLCRIRKLGVAPRPVASTA